jgi:ribosome maturation factor RimP
MALADFVHQTVTGLGYELVELDRSAGGLLRVTIDWPWAVGVEPRAVTTEDCEKVTRQLQFGLEVEGVEYRRLEVSSPGVDRLLRNDSDLERFCGELVDLTLKAPVGVEVAAGSGGAVNANRKKFQGRLEAVEVAAGADAQVPSNTRCWQLVWQDDVLSATAKVGQKPGKKALERQAQAPWHALGFEWHEVRELRLAPVVDFKGRGDQ